MVVVVVVVVFIVVVVGGGGDDGNVPRRTIAIWFLVENDMFTTINLEVAERNNS